MALSIARDLMHEGIRMDAILPGIFATPAMPATGEVIRLDGAIRTAPR